MTLTIDVFLPWVLPPLLGAIIGYVTNALAIRMIFRPHREWRIAGIRIPFTPGIIPRRRHELARNIARMVSRQLLTEDVLLTRIAEEDFLPSLQGAIGESLRRVFSTPFAEVERTWRVSQLVERVLTVVITPERVQYIIESLDTGGSEGARSFLGEMRPFSSRDIYLRFFDTHFDEGKELLLRALRAPHARRELSRHGRRILSFAIDQLSSLQRLMVTAGQYERQMQIKMPEIVDVAIREFDRSLGEEENRLRIRAAVEEWLKENRDTTLSALVGDFDAMITSLFPHLVRFLRKAFENGAPARSAARHIKGIVEHHPDRSLGAVLGADRLLTDGNLHMLARLALEALRRGVGPLVSRLDVGGMVVRKIDSLAVDEVEELLMGILRRHLKWINVFGAGIGAIIGAAQFVLASLI